MAAAGFHLDPVSGQPGAWIDRDGIPVDLMAPEGLASTRGRRGARLPPHSKRSVRRALGLEAAMVDHGPMRVGALSPDDSRVHMVNVAGPTALLVAKLHKLAEREGQPDRRADKDAHDLYRLLAAVPTEQFVEILPPPP